MELTQILEQTMLYLWLSWQQHNDRLFIAHQHSAAMQSAIVIQ